MVDLLPTGGLLAAFLVATLVLAVTPGPGVLYVVARTLAQGRTAGLASVAGVALGNLGNAIGASVGLAAVFAVSAVAFTAVKFAGAAYLIYLGIQALRQPKVQEASLSLGTAERRRIFRDGLFVALLNPKTTIFFAAFLPQFIEGTSSPVFQSIALSAVFVLIAACTDSAYVMLSTVFAPALRAGRPIAAYGRFFGAIVYFGLGVYAVLAEAHTSRAVPK